MAKKEKLDLLTAVERIVEKAKGTGLSSEFYRKADRYITYLSEKMELTREQSVMMAILLDNCDNTSITISDFCTFLDCRATRIIRYIAEIDVLEKRDLVRCCRDENRLAYRVPLEVVDSFKLDKKYTPKDCSGLSSQELFGEIEDIFEQRRNGELTYDATVEKIEHLFNCNKQLIYVQKINSFNLCENEKMLLILFSYYFVNKNNDNIDYFRIEFLYDDKRYWNLAKLFLNNGTHVLICNGMIEFNNDDGFVERDSFRMTKETKRVLFAEFTSLNQGKKRGDVIKSEEIVPKRLFYSDKVHSQIEELGKLLENEKYNMIRSRMKDTGFRCGFTCLFYGEPGTGKTESVLQLARQTGRDIFQVNISQIKSKWVGESEKNIRQVFDYYRTKVKESDVTPILLFNEADAIIGKRLEGAERAVEKMENTIQNIILQEIETLDGILIATTNLAQNIDLAFERLFLYKIKFDKPNIESRMCMWHEMIPVLNEEETRILANKYNFNGGQIENIARHYTIGNILHGESENIVEVLSNYCDSERLYTKERHKIGFNV